MKKLLVYQDISTAVVSALREDGFEVYYVSPENTEEAKQEVLEKVNGEGYLLLTGSDALADTFAQKVQAGIILFKGTQQLPELRVLIKTLHELGTRVAAHLNIINDKGLQKQKPLQTA